MVIEIKFKSGKIKEYRDSQIKYETGFVTVRKWNGSLESFPSETIEKIDQMEEPRF